MIKFVKIFLFCGITFSGAAQPYTFPPFDRVDLSFGQKDADDNLKLSTPVLESVIPYHEKSLEELRAIMTFGGNSEQYHAAKTLVRAGDEKTILRLIYSLKQGNPDAEEILKSLPSRQVIPFLMEEVAHGSMEYYHDNWPHIGYGRVRVTATEVVATTLTSIDEFPEPTRKWLRYVGGGNSSIPSNNVSEKSRFLVEWWILNEKAFLAGKWDEAIPVPNAGTYTPRPKPGPPSPYIEPVLVPARPWKFEPFHVPESFEEWAARIVHPEKRDLRWVELTEAGDKWAERPARNLNPLAPPTMQSRTIRRSLQATEKQQPSNQWLVWKWGVCVAALLGPLLWWWVRRNQSIAG